jgi:putative flippase GtrA
MWRFTKFLFVGGINTAFGYLVFLVAYWLVGVHQVAILIATVVGALFNFLTTGRYVFDNRDSRALLRFLAAYALVYVVNLLLVEGIMYLGPGAVLAQLMCVPLIATLSYFVMAKFVFR